MLARANTITIGDLQTDTLYNAYCFGFFRMGKLKFQAHNWQQYIYRMAFLNT